MIPLILISAEDSASQSLMIQIFYIVSSIALGMQQCASTLVGNSIGGLHVSKGKRFTGFLILFNLGVSLILVILVLSTK